MCLSFSNRTVKKIFTKGYAIQFRIYTSIGCKKAYFNQMRLLTESFFARNFAYRDENIMFGLVLMNEKITMVSK
jgi:hypothetical protein